MGRLRSFFALLCVWAFVLEAAEPSAWWDIDPHEVRDQINHRIFSIAAEQPSVYTVNDITIRQGNRTTPLRIYRPNNTENLPIVLLIHGPRSSIIEGLGVPLLTKPSGDSL
jgi:acetyl esterase/lipase